MKVAVFNIGKILSGDLAAPVARGDTVLCKLGHAFAEYDAGVDHWAQILDVSPGVGATATATTRRDRLVREASGLLEALFHDNEGAPGAKLHEVMLAFGISAIFCIVSRSVNSVC